VVRPRSCRVIYYCDTPALGIRHQLFDRVKSANHLGQILAERKIHLVYGGGSLGLMGSVSIAAFLGGSQVLGIVPKALAKGDIIGKTIG